MQVTKLFKKKKQIFLLVFSPAVKMRVAIQCVLVFLVHIFTVSYILIIIYLD